MPELTTAKRLAVQTGPQARRPWDECLAKIFIGLCVVVALAPLPLGAGRPLAWDALGLATAGLLLAAGAFPPREPDISHRDLLGPLLLFAIVIGYAALQTVTLTPAGWHDPLWDQAAEGLGRTLAGTIAIDPAAGRVGIFRLLSYGGIFYLSLMLGREPARAQRAVWVVAVAGSVYAAYGLAVYGTGNKLVLWLPKWAYFDDLTGTFVNRNSFATYLGLSTLAMLCHLVASFGRLRLAGDCRLKFTAAIDFASSHVWQIVCLFLLLTALLLTHSRGGLISTLAGVLALGLAISQAPSLGGLRRVGFVALPLAVILLAFFISGGMTLDRLGTAGDDAQARFEVYRLTWQAIANDPLRGTGLNSFASVFPMYQPATLHAYFGLAHNDYLQNLLELGVPAALCLFGTIAWLVILCGRGVRRRRRDALYPCLGIAATVLVAVHSMMDFSLQIPAVTATYVFLLGVAVAQSRSSRAAPPASLSAAPAPSRRQ